jgi:hypothetical protein
MIKWISNLEERIIHEVIETHELHEGEQPGREDPDGKPSEFHAYSEEDKDVELLVPDPYSELYVYYIFSMIDFHNGETDRYSNSMIMYNNAYSNWFNHYNRTHMPKGVPLRL